MVQEDKKGRILDAALRLFVEKGIDNTSTSLISKEAGIATGTLYLYFKNKVDLINELYTSIEEEKLSIFDTSVSEYSTEFFEKSWMDTIEWGVNNPDKFKFIRQFNSSPYYANYDNKRLADNEKHILKLIKSGVEKKQLKNLPPEYMLGLLSVHLALTMEYTVNTKTKERKMFFESLLEGIKY